MNLGSPKLATSVFTKKSSSVRSICPVMNMDGLLAVKDSQAVIFEIQRG